MLVVLFVVLGSAYVFRVLPEAAVPKRAPAVLPIAENSETSPLADTRSTPCVFSVTMKLPSGPGSALAGVNESAEAAAIGYPPGYTRFR